jgi:hypothetical protein
MREFFDHLNKVETDLLPIDFEYWDKFHRWPAEEIGKVLDDKHIVDLGSGCGLLSCYLVWNGTVESATLYEPRFHQAKYSERLADLLGISDKIKVNKFQGTRKIINNSTIVSHRLGSLQVLEEFIYTNKLITCRRTSEVEPIFIRDMNLPWNIKEIEYKDGFKLELLQYSHDDLVKLVSGERWMEDISPFILEIIHSFDLTPVNKIGGDFIEQFNKE